MGQPVMNPQLSVPRITSQPIPRPGPSADEGGNRMIMPNFLVIGAAKSGTTALYYALRQHPQIYMSRSKEPNFFALEGEPPAFRGPGDQQTINSDSITSLADYQRLFHGVSLETAIGEASTAYLYHERTSERIRHYIPSAKLIVILRHPVERAYSSFLHMVRDGREPLADFSQALQAEQARIHDHWEHIWHYTHMGFYSVQLKRYFDTFDYGQIKIHLYDEWVANPLEVMRETFRFLGVDERFVPDLSLHPNVSGIPRNRLLQTILTKLNPAEAAFNPSPFARLFARRAVSVGNHNLVKPPIPPAVRSELGEVFREDIVKLQDLIQRDLSVWLGKC